MNPCYRKKCQLRSAECKKTCPDWQEYEAQHMAELKAKWKRTQESSDFNNFKKTVIRRSSR